MSKLSNLELGKNRRLLNPQLSVSLRSKLVRKVLLTIQMSLSLTTSIPKLKVIERT